MKTKTNENAHLYSQLVRLGDMIGDGLDREPGGAWIRKEYRQVMKALGHTPPATRKPRANASDAINAAMAERLKTVRCKGCNGDLRQTRSGSMKAVCQCGAKYTLLKRARR